jgi:hypothetical protein
MDGIWITNEIILRQTLYGLFGEHPRPILLTPIMEGIFNYAIYTLGVEK